VVAAISGLERGTNLGQGLFSLADLRAYVTLSGSRDDGDRVLFWLHEALNPVQHRAKRPDYSFGDLISLFVVRELKKKGVRTRVIREAEDYLRTKWSTARPFASDEIKTDGCGVFVDDELVAGDQIESADRHGQQVLREAVREKLTHVKYDEGWASTWNPARHVVIDPRVQFGEPVVAGTRIPTGSIADMATHAPVERIAADMGIKVKQAQAALSFEQLRATALN
jgi:uncharacterized protein (DUF433 family)/GNAT superfamily N-acetyltransferase